MYTSNGMETNGRSVRKRKEIDLTPSQNTTMLTYKDFVIIKTPSSNAILNYEKYEQNE